jgi:hypothetical protein
LVQGYFGHYFEEVLADTRASWGNPLSYWLTEESLFRMLLLSGFSSILKVVPSPVTADRTFYVALPIEDDRLDRLRTGFNRECEDYSLEPQLMDVSVSIMEGDRSAVDVAKYRSERDAAVLRLNQLRSRKSVAAALALARPFAPVYRILRRPKA